MRNKMLMKKMFKYRIRQIHANTCKSKIESIYCPKQNDENVYYVEMNNEPLKGVQKSISDISIPGRVLKFNSQRENF